MTLDELAAVSLDELLAEMRQATGPERKRAQKVFWRAVRAELHRYYRRKVGPRDADDLTQETLKYVHKNLERIQPRGPDHFRRLLRKVAKTTVRGHWRTLAQREAQRSKLRLWPPPLPPGTPSSQVLASERAALIAQVQHSPRVTTRDRGAIDHGDHHSLAEAEGIGLSVARKRWNRAVDKVRTLVEVIRRTGRVRTLTPKSS